MSYRVKHLYWDTKTGTLHVVSEHNDVLDRQLMQRRRTLHQSLTSRGTWVTRLTTRRKV